MSKRVDLKKQGTGRTTPEIPGIICQSLSLSKLFTALMVPAAFLASPASYAEWVINETSANYFSWEFSGQSPVQGDHVLILFGEQPGISLDSLDTHKWLRTPQEEQAAWLPESSSGSWYARVCDYHLANAVCYSYSDEVSLSNQVTQSTKNIGLSFTYVEPDYVAWQTQDGDTAFGGEHMMILFSESPDISAEAENVHAWYRHISDPLEAWVGESPSGNGWYYRLCEFNMAKTRCDNYSEEVFSGVRQTPDAEPPEDEPPVIPVTGSGEFTITWIHDGFIAWSTDGRIADDVLVLFGDSQELALDAPGTTVYGSQPGNEGYSWLNGSRYVQLCHVDYERNDCVVTSEVFDTVFPQLDNYPEHLPPMVVPMGSGQRRQSPYDPTTTVDNFPISPQERADSLPPLAPGTFAANPNLAPDNGRFYYECGVSHIGYDDPIVFFGQPGVAHLHMFIGNQHTDAFTTTQSLLDTETASTCRGNRLNRSAYWVPPVYDSFGNAYIPDASEFLFVNYSTGVAPDNMVRFPEGFRMLAGNAMAGAAQEPFARWQCSSLPGSFSSIPACPAGATLSMILDFPQCWDGVNIDAPDQKSHMAYPSYNPAIEDLTCPASHPVVLPAITFDIRYDVHPELVGEFGDTRDWYLSSDMYSLNGVNGGFSIHGDFMNAWDDETLQLIIDGCIKIPGGNCNNSQLPGDIELRQRIRGAMNMNTLPVED